MPATEGGHESDTRSSARGSALAVSTILSLAPAAWAGGDHHVLGNDGVWEVATGMDDRGNSYCSSGTSRAGLRPIRC